MSIIEEDELQRREARFRASWDTLEAYLTQPRIANRQDAPALLELIHQLRFLAYDEWIHVTIELHHFVFSRSISEPYPKLYIQFFLMGDKIMVIGHLRRLYPIILSPVALSNELKIMLELLLFAPLD